MMILGILFALLLVMGNRAFITIQIKNIFVRNAYAFCSSFAIGWWCAKVFMGV